MSSFATRARTEKMRKVQLATMSQPASLAAVTASKPGAESASELLDMVGKDSDK